VWVILPTGKCSTGLAKLPARRVYWLETVTKITFTTMWIIDSTVLDKLFVNSHADSHADSHAEHDCLAALSRGCVQLSGREPMNQPLPLSLAICLFRAPTAAAKREPIK
jgi:hypothetical protein